MLSRVIRLPGTRWGFYGFFMGSKYQQLYLFLEASYGFVYGPKFKQYYVFLEGSFGFESGAKYGALYQYGLSSISDLLGYAFMY